MNACGSEALNVIGISGFNWKHFICSYNKKHIIVIGPMIPSGEYKRVCLHPDFIAFYSASCTLLIFLLLLFPSISLLKITRLLFSSFPPVLCSYPQASREVGVRQQSRVSFSPAAPLCLVASSNLLSLWYYRLLWVEQWILPFRLLSWRPIGGKYRQ